MLFIFNFYKPVSFTEGDLRLLALPGGSSISVMGGRGGLHHVPVNFNHIKLSRPLTEGMPALYIPLARLLSLKWRFPSFVEVLWEQSTIRNTCLTWKLLQTEDIVRGMIQTEAFLSQLSYILHNKSIGTYFYFGVWIKSGSYFLSCVRILVFLGLSYF